MEIIINPRIWDLKVPGWAAAEAQFQYYLKKNPNLSAALKAMGLINAKVYRTGAGEYEIVLSTKGAKPEVLVGLEVIDERVALMIDKLRGLKESHGFEWVDTAMGYIGESWDITNYPAMRYNIGQDVTIAAILMSGFTWSQTPEGNKYWETLHNQMAHLNP